MPNGYNMQTGGQTKHYEAYYTFTEKDIVTIYDLLLNTNYSYTDIGNMYGVSVTMIKHINDGKEYVQNGMEYPIRSKITSKEIQKLNVSKKLSGENSYRTTITTETAYDIIYDLTFNLNLKSIDIAKKYNTTIDVVKDINRFKS